MPAPVGSTVQAFAIDTHAGGDNQGLDRALHQGLEEDSRAERIHPPVLANFIHALPDTDSGGQVKHRIHTTERSAYCVAMAHVTTDQLNVWMQVIRTLTPAAVDLRGEHIQHAYLVVVRQQFIG